MTTTIIGKRPWVTSVNDDLFIGAELPTDQKEYTYVIKSIPPGFILQSGGLLWETMGGGLNQPLGADNAGEYIGVIL
jgi:hypothetical protein